MDAGDAGVDEGLRLLGGELDADLELVVGIVAGRFQAADEVGRQLGAAQRRDPLESARSS